MMAVFIAQLFLLLQHIMPKRLITAIVHRLARIRIRLIKDFLIRSFVKLYEVNLDEVQKSVPDGFINFNDFFIREMADGSRPIDSSDLSIVSPADGIISAAGSIERNAVFQAKGHDYSLEELLATDLVRRLRASLSPHILFREHYSASTRRRCHSFAGSSRETSDSFATSERPPARCS
jgi:phosphatidylserine decarboxylase